MTAETLETPVTRMEIAKAVGHALTNTGDADRAQLIEAAREAGARHEVLLVLDQLGGRGYSDLRQLWGDLPELPVA